jgi:hypothetical protein
MFAVASCVVDGRSVLFLFMFLGYSAVTSSVVKQFLLC